MATNLTLPAAVWIAASTLWRTKFGAGSWAHGLRRGQIVAELANLVGEDASCGSDDPFRRPEYRDIAGIALGVALLGPVTAI